MVIFVTNVTQSEIIHDCLCYCFPDTVKEGKGIEFPVTNPKGWQRAAAMSVVSVIVRYTTLKRKKNITKSKAGW